MAELVIRNLHLAFQRKTILDGIDFSMMNGEIHGLLGINGAGKSSFMRSLFGDLKKTKYLAFMNGTAIDLSQQHLQHIAYLPQDPFLMKGVKVTDAVQYWYEDPKDQDQILYEPMVHSMHHNKVGEMSMGERRFLEFLLILYLPHHFLLLDEPFSGLAPLQIQRAQELILERKTTKGIVISDHYFDHVLKVTTKNWVLQNGKLKEVNAADVKGSYRRS